MSTLPVPSMALIALITLTALATGCVGASVSELNVYLDLADKTVAEDVEAFAPRFPLWTDGAEKRRFIRLPDGATINTRDPDRWVFPVGTTLMKEIIVDEKVAETRAMTKDGEDSWRMATYVWNDAGTDAFATPFGEADVHESQHDVPGALACLMCHGDDERPLGFTAMQLDHDGPGLNVERLVAQGRLSHPPTQRYTLPGDALDQQVLGAQHVCCGSCHSDNGFMARVPLRLRLKTDALDTVAATPTGRTAVGQVADTTYEGRDTYLTPGAPDDSLILLRMSRRGDEVQMPPIATETPDTQAVARLTRWLERSGGQANGAAQ